MDEDSPTRPASISAQRVRDHRARRRAAGLVEVKVWVREQDVPHTHAALRLFTNEADQALDRLQRQGRTNLVVFELHFPNVPPGQFRGQLQRDWGLAWDQGAGRWHGELEDQSRLDQLRQFVAVHGGVIEVPTQG
jgi:hypothetical protein